MAMTLEQTRQAIIDRMQSFTGIAQERIQYPNAPGFTVPKEGLWCRLTIAGGPSFISGIADKPCTRRTGNIMIQCFARPNSGIMEITKLSDALLAHFEYYSIDHLEFLQGQSSYAEQNKDFVQYNLIISYVIN
ncbi:phage tail terminator-like protein [Acinetobacter baumannii]